MCRGCFVEIADLFTGSTQFMTIPVLQTARLTMRPFEMDDAPIVQRLAGMPDVALTTLRIPHPYEDGMAEDWISTHQAAWDARESLVFALIVESEGLVGAAGIELNEENDRGEIGYWIGLDYWNRGYATEAAAALIEFGFGELNLNRIQARYFTRNPASGRVLEKAGMKYEGVLRQHMLVRGTFEDIVICSILNSDV
jgi:RimJ/RimL family protein N-acetyltransferase